MVKLQRISVVPLAKIFCLFHTVIGVILGIIVTIGSLTNPQEDNSSFWSLGPWSLLVFPIVNAVFGFLTGMFLASAYNLFSKWVGAIEIDIDEEKEQQVGLVVSQVRS